MEQQLYAVSIMETNDMGCRNYSCSRESFPLSALTKDATLTVSESWGQPNPADANDCVHIVWELTDMELTDDTFSFTMKGQRFKLNRHWQVLGTLSYGIPNAYISASKRFIFYFSTEERTEESQFEQFQSLYNQMVANEGNGEYWKNIPLGHEALHLMKDVAPLQDEDTFKQFCELVVDGKLLSEIDTPRLMLSFMDFWHALVGSTYKYDNETYRLLVMTSPRFDDNEKMSRIEDIRHLRYDPVQLSEAWEENIYDVEEELDKLFKDEERHMGFCFRYWSAKQAAWAKRGIEWRSPQIMNPKVRFD